MQPSTHEPIKNLLTVVIIARNEAKNIGRCIESALALTARFPDTEVLLADSASTDKTIEIARQYPISIIQLRPDWVLTPSAGRYLGTLATSSEYILFLDGDTELYLDWFGQALDFLQTHANVAGVGGILEEHYTDAQGQLTGHVLRRYEVSALTEVGSFGGNGLYRRAALDKAGTFHPYLAFYEEAELALRLRKAGYTLWELPVSMSRHFSMARETLQEERRRLRAGFYAKVGWAVRAAAKNGLTWPMLSEFMWDYVITAVYVGCGLLTLIVMFAGYPIGLLIWLATSLLIFVAYSVRKRSPYKALAGMVARLLAASGLVVGLFTGGQNPEQYPTNVIVIQKRLTE